jgi:hypothetical protein
MEVIGFRCGPWRWYKGEGGNTYEQGEERGGKEMSPYNPNMIVSISDTAFIWIRVLNVYCFDIRYKCRVVIKW